MREFIGKDKLRPIVNPLRESVVVRSIMKALRRSIVVPLRRISRRRIPVIMVTGTNGKTTTVRMTSHVLKEYGHQVGYTSSEGVVCVGKMVLKGDQTGYKGARAVLTNKDVTAAVLEVARGDLLHRGLYIDRCDAAVLLNVDREQIGIGGIDTTEEMAAHKRQVIDAGRTVVLNADDKLCADMIKDYAPEKTILFSMDDDNPIIQRHIDQGGSAIFLGINGDKKESIFFADQNSHQLLLLIASLPSAVGGIVRHNIANAMAAAALTLAVGIPLEVVRKALATFENSLEHSPGRFNQLEGYPFRIIIDHARNPPAARVLMKCIMSLSAKRKLCMLTVVGNRPDSIFQEMAEAIAGYFDIYVIYEIEEYRRTRYAGEIVNNLRQALINAGIDELNLRTALETKEAFQILAAMARTDDLILLMGIDVNSLPELNKIFKRLA